MAKCEAAVWTKMIVSIFVELYLLCYVPFTPFDVFTWFGMVVPAIPPLQPHPSCTHATVPGCAFSVHRLMLPGSIKPKSCSRVLKCVTYSEAAGLVANT